MAQQDFCFTYYDGDAARDKAHMNRLERGAYDDIISAQRKRGHLTIYDLKRVLGSDFDSCFPAQEWILKKDDSEKLFIEWVDVSITKSKKHSEKQSANGQNGGRPLNDFLKFRKDIIENIENIDFDFEIGFCEKEKRESFYDKKLVKYFNQCLDFLIEIKPKQNPNNSQKNPLGDGNGDGDEIGFKNEYKDKGGTGGKNSNALIPKMAAEFKRFNTDYPEDAEKDYPALLKIAAFIGKKIDKPFIVNEDFETAMMPYWSHLCEKIPKDKFFKNYSISQVEKHIQSIVLTIQDGNSTNRKQNSRITADDLEQAHAKYFN